MAALWVTHRGCPRVLDARANQRARALCPEGHAIPEIVRRLEISRETFDRYQAQWRIPTLRVGLLAQRRLGTRGDEPVQTDVELVLRIAERLGARLDRRAASCRDLYRGLDELGERLRGALARG